MSSSPLHSPRMVRVRWKRVAAMLLLLAATTACSPQSEPGVLATHATAPTAAAPLPPEGQRWATDAPLRAGMARIRQAVEALEHGVHGHLDAAQQQAAAAQVDAAVADMIANCKLVPEADASLHGLLATFIAGATAARDGRFTQAELVPMQEALVQYQQRFDDPTWTQPTPE